VAFFCACCYRFYQPPTGWMRYNNFIDWSSAFSDIHAPINRGIEGEAEKA